MELNDLYLLVAASLLSGKMSAPDSYAIVHGPSTAEIEKAVDVAKEIWEVILNREPTR